MFLESIKNIHSRFSHIFWEGNRPTDCLAADAFRILIFTG